MAYRFNGTSSNVAFGISPFNGYTFGAFTIAAFFKRSSTSAYDWVFFSDSSGGTGKLFQGCLSGAAGNHRLYSLSESAFWSLSGGWDTTNWFLVAATMANATSTPRFHWHNGTSWTHTTASAGSAWPSGGVAIGSTDKLYVSAPTAWGGEFFAGDMVCAGVKKSDSTDLQIETLSRTDFTTWTGYGFEWLAGFETSSTVVNRSNPGSGDETARTSVSLVSDPPGWTWAPILVPVAGFTGTPTSGSPSLSVAFTDSSTNTPTSWSWNFGDGGTSTSQNPTHSYTTSGLYTVALTATNAAGSNTLTRTAYITVGETIAYVSGGRIDIY